MPDGTETEKRGPNVLAPPPLLYAGPLLVGFLLDWLLPLPGLPVALRWLGLPFLAAGLALVLWFGMTMMRARTPIDPREAPTALVQNGPFAHTRNPAYLGFAIIYTGVSLLAGSRWSLLLLPAVLLIIDRGVIQREERYLQEHFGDYREYRGRVRRWL